MTYLQDAKMSGKLVQLNSWQRDVSRVGANGADQLGERLMLRRDAIGVRHSLCGRWLDTGEFLELQRADGSWLLGRFEWSHRQGDRPFLFTDEDRALELS